MKLQKSASAGFTAEDMLRIGSDEPSDRPALEQNPSRALLRLAEAMSSLKVRPPVSSVVITGLVRLAEFLLLWTTGLAAHVAAGSASHAYTLVYLLAIPAIALVASSAFQAARLNTISALRVPVEAGVKLILIWAGLLLLVLGGLAAAHPSEAFSQQWLALWAGASTFGLVAERGLVWAIVRVLTNQGRLERRTVIVGGGKAGEDLIAALAEQSDSDLRLIGVFDDRNDTRSPDMVGGLPKLGSVTDLVAFARRTRIDLVIFTLPITAEERLLHMLRKLWVLPIDIRLAAHRNKLRFRPRSYSYIGAVPVLDVFDKPIADWDVIFKSVFDRIVGAVALAILAPVMLLTALAIKLDSKGSILFKQKRHGFNNESVEVFKFRSLYADQLDYSAQKLVTKDDPRVTRVGRFIRKTSIDELPQLFNVVFKGNLSLVGPRPHAVHAHMANRAYDEVVEGYFARHRVKPGITGWAQVNGWRGETDTPLKIQKRIEHDLTYIENWSIFFDLYILLITPFALTRTESAY